MSDKGLWVVMRCRVDREEGQMLPFQIGDTEMVRAFRAKKNALAFKRAKQQSTRNFDYSVRHLAWGPEA